MLDWGRIAASRTLPIKNASCPYSAYGSSANKFPVQHFLYASGDTGSSLAETKKVLDEIITDFITEICFEAHRGAQLAGRQKVKLDDIKFACRKNPEYLGKIEEMTNKKSEIDKARKLVDGSDDKLMKNTAKAALEEEEPLGDADDDIETKTLGGRSTGK